MNFDHKFSERARVMKASEIREILKLTQRPEIISFAGGLPNPLTFPKEIIREIVVDLLDKNPELPLQYGTTEGVNPLREEIAKMCHEDGMDVGYEDIIITHGSQQALDLIGKVLLNPTDVVIVGAPTYLGANSVWNQNRASLHEVTVDDDGQVIEEAEVIIKDLKARDHNVKFMYIMPNFHNPAGVTLSDKRRKMVLDLAKDQDLLILEDDPYGKIRFEGSSIRSIKARDDEGRVIYTSTFSKLLAPGFRIAWCTAHPDILHKMVLAKQSTDLNTNTFGQYVTYEYMARGHFKRHVPNIIKLYKEKCDIMVKAMKEYFPKEVKFTIPQGGMFSWAQLPEYVDAKHVLNHCIAKNVAYVVGSAFYANPLRGKSKMRLNFTHPANDLIPVGIKVIAEAIEEHLRHPHSSH